LCIGHIEYRQKARKRDKGKERKRRTEGRRTEGKEKKLKSRVEEEMMHTWE
jgi:hypothetical protein